MNKLDVTVRLYKNGVLISGPAATDDTTARLGRALIGRMKIGRG